MVVAAGGLGTRVHAWARYLPKEWMPVQGRPGLVHLLEEIAEVGPAHAVVVYHPYYERFAAWARQVLAGDGRELYRRAAGQALPDGGTGMAGVTVEWVAQAGAYGDLTSLLNGADHLGPFEGELLVAFGDNLYPSGNPLAALRQAPPGVAVLARPYRADLAGRRGVIVTEPGAGGTRRAVELVEKPSPAAAAALQDRYGADSLTLLEGRARLDGGFVDFARTHTHAGTGGEPKLALALAAYARTESVHVVCTTSAVVDLGAPVGQRTP